MAEDALSSLRQRFSGAIRLEPHQRRLYGYDASGGRGLPDAVVYVRSAEDLLSLVEIAKAHGLTLVARGSGTGLSGGSVADRGSIAVSFERMRRVQSLDPLRRRAWVEAGHVNGLLDPVLEPYGLYFPPDPASHRVSTIGGNVAENAGGPHAVKYGVTGQHVVAVSIVDASGQSGRLTGGTLQPWADLVSLVVGSEGTLCFVLAAELSLEARPQTVATMLVSFRSMDQGTDFVSAVVAQGMVPATLEFLDRAHIEAIEAWGVAHYPEGAGAVLLMEYDGNPDEVLRDVRRTEELAKGRGALGCTTTRDPKEREGLWLGRRGAYAVIARYGRRLLTQDVTVPRQRLTEMLEAVERIAQRHQLMVATVGHAGDGNLHPSFPYDPDDQDQSRRVHLANDEVMRACVALDGSISGEHGIGQEKLHQMAFMFSQTELGLMAEVRRALDPYGLLNPGKAVPDVPRTAVHGVGQRIAAPRCAEEVQAAILQAAGGAEPLDISLTGMQGIDPDLANMTLEVGAGARIADIEEALEHTPLELRLSPLRSRTIAGAVLLNDYGPEHLGSGTVRSQLLAARYVTGAGEIVRMGRPVVKNVAGYDLFRLLIGSRGTLAVPVSFTLRLQPRRPLGWWRTEGVELERVLEEVPPDALSAFVIPRSPGYALYAQVAAPDAGWVDAPEAAGVLRQLRERISLSPDVLDLRLPDAQLGRALKELKDAPVILLPKAARVLGRVPNEVAGRLVEALGAESPGLVATFGDRYLELHRSQGIEAEWRDAVERVFDPHAVLSGWFHGEGS